VGHEQRTFEMPLVRAWNFAGLRVLPTDLAIAAVALTCLLLVFALLHHTSLGRQLRAIADSAELARASGIRTHRLMLVLWLLRWYLSWILLLRRMLLWMVLGLLLIVYRWELQNNKKNILRNNRKFR